MIVVHIKIEKGYDITRKIIKGNIMRFLLLSCILLLNSCVYFKAAINGVKKPEVEVEAIELGKSDFRNIELNVSLAIENPNDFSIKLTKLDYKVFYKNLKLASGSKSNPVELKAMATSRHDLGLNVSPTSLLLGAGDLLSGDKAKLRVKASAVFETPISNIKYEYNKDHTIK